MFADGLNLGVHTLHVVAVCYKYLRSEHLRLRVESPLGGWLHSSYGDVFDWSGVDWRIVAQLGVMLCDVVPVMHEREHDADCLNTSHGFWVHG